jgi:hypothetical protein
LGEAVNSSCNEVAVKVPDVTNFTLVIVARFTWKMPPLAVTVWVSAVVPGVAIGLRGKGK